MERTLLIVKPDALQRKLTGRIVSRFEEKGFQIIAAKMARLPEKTIREHYGAHKGKVFYEPLVRYMTAQPVLLLVDAPGKLRPAGQAVQLIQERGGLVKLPGLDARAHPR